MTKMTKRISFAMIILDTYCSVKTHSKGISNLDHPDLGIGASVDKEMECEHNTKSLIKALRGI